MTMDTWKAGSDVTDQMNDLIKKYHPHLMVIQDEIAIIFKERASERGGKVILGQTKKAPPIIGVLTDKKYEYRFYIELGADTWQSDLSDNQRLALLDHHLCAMRVEEDENSGEIKCSLRPPDVIGFREEMERWGTWRPTEEEIIPNED